MGSVVMVTMVAAVVMCGRKRVRGEQQNQGKQQSLFHAEHHSEQRVRSG
jgi:hypothetical protein